MEEAVFRVKKFGLAAWFTGVAALLCGKVAGTEPQFNWSWAILGAFALLALFMLQLYLGDERRSRQGSLLLGPSLVFGVPTAAAIVLFGDANWLARIAIFFGIIFWSRIVMAMFE